MGTKTFIEKSSLIHKNKYDYSKVIYKTTNEKVCIICPKHGEFWQTPHNHLKGHGCPKCSTEINAGKKRLTIEEFIKRAKEVHGDKYDYSKVNYESANKKVCIIDPEYGEFWQKPESHLKGRGCKVGYGKRAWDTRGRMDTEGFIKKAKAVHGDKYDYSKVNYIDSRTKICVICPIHGEFTIAPFNLLNGRGCQKCSKENQYRKQTHTTEEFIKKAKTVHGEYFDYSKVKYESYNKKVCIIDPEYGEFWQTPASHLRGYGCKYRRSNKKTTEYFIERAKAVHGDKYDYSKVKYESADKKVCVTCQKHGEFWVTPSNHYRGKGCPKCGTESAKLKQSLTPEEFIKKAKVIHGEYFDYSKVNYESAHKKVCIIDPEYGEFWQTPTNHLTGYGCYLSNLKRNKSENKIYELLKRILTDDEIIRQASPNWLGKQRFDFLIPSKNIAIEYQGLQHFEPVSIFGGENGFKRTRKCDISKNEKASKHDIKILYFTYVKPEFIDFPYSVITDENKLLEEIKNS